MFWIRFSVWMSVVAVTAVLLPACNDAPLPWVGEQGRIDDPDALSEFRSARDLEGYLKRAIDEQYGAMANGRDGEVAIPISVETGGEEIASRSGDFSRTNVQESGVDEADRLKSDGRYLYVVTRQEPLTAPGGGVVELMTSPRPERSRVRVMELGEEPAAAREVADLELSEAMRATGSYLLTDRESGGPDLLLVLGRGKRTASPAGWFAPWSWRSGESFVTLVDVDDPVMPRVIARLLFDGHLVASRRIDETLYLVTRHYPWVEGYRPYPETRLQRRLNQELLDAAPLSALLPGWRVDDGPRKGYLASARNCYLPPVGDDHRSADIISVIAIDLRNPTGAPRARCIIGPTEAVYVSRESLYLATTRQRYVIQTDARLAREMVIYPPEERTWIHKFALTGSGPRFRGSGSVGGHLGWEQDKKSFRMGERDGVLFIATSLGRSWSMDATTRLTVLAEERGGEFPRLKELARLPNEKRPEPIGLPGERLYAARFVGERGYLVTFRVTDPLYVLDLSDPADPFIAGSLKVPGYSDYLHPVSDTVLLGIGKSAVAADGAWGDGRGAWYQGLRLALFDVSDPGRPREMDSIEIGGRGTDSNALRDHLAVTWLPADRERGRPARLALPVKLHAVVPTPAPMKPWEQYPWTHTGLHMFDIYDGGGPEKRMPGIVERGRMVVESAEYGDSASWLAGDRALIGERGVHYLHGNSVWSASWGEPDTMVGPQ